ncbi:MAG: glycosyltransferase family 39 protein [Anaerolineae bacterium]
MSTRETRTRILLAILRRIVIVGAVVGACLAQLQLDRTRNETGLLISLALVGAAILFALATQHLGNDPNTADDLAIDTWIPLWRRLLGILAIPACIYAWLRMPTNQFSWDGVLAWLGALIVLLVSTYQPPLHATPRQPLLSRSGLHLDWIRLGVLGAIVIGAILRLWRLAEIPAEMGPDLPHNFNNIRLILTGQYPIYFPSWPGREAFFFYLAALPAALSGLSHLSIKLTGALIGIATIPVIYLLGKELYERELGLIAAILYAASHWAIITSRTGLRMVMVPLLLAFTWLFWLRGLKQRRTWYLALAGLCLGLGLHTYTAFLAVPALLLVWIVAEVIAGRGHTLQELRWGLVSLVVIALVVFMPLLRYSLDFPGDYLLRISTRVTAVENPLPAQPLLALLINIKNAFLMFNVTGDMVANNNIAGFRELGFVAAVFLPLGAAYLISRPRRGFNLNLLLSLIVMVLPSVLSLAFPREVPNAGRAIGALPAAILIPAWGLNLLRRTLQGGATSPTDNPQIDVPDESIVSEPTRGMRVGRWLSWLVVFGLLIGETGAAFPLYFDSYRLHQTERNYSISLAMAQVMDKFADNGTVYIKTQGYWYDGNAVKAQLTRLPGWDNEFWTLDPTKQPMAGPPGKVLIILHPNDKEALNTLHAAYKYSATVTYFNYIGIPSFIAFYGER